MRLLILLFCLISTSFSACDNREQKLRKKEQELVQKEQELLLKEHQLEVREQELLKIKESKIDSNKTGQANSKAAIAGSWTVKMVCIETDCEGSAIGDVKNEHWQISSENQTVLARATVNQKLVRVYTGEQRKNIIELSAEQTASETSNEAKIFVKLKQLSPEKIEGKREIFREGCRIVYSLELNKQ